MSKSLSDVFHRLTITAPSRSGALQIFGLQLDAPARLRYQTLDEAMGQSAIEVTEVSEGGSVPKLRLINKSASMVFLMAGEQLIGAKQNRVLNTSLMVSAGADVQIPVSCVEQSRWSYRSKQFGSHGTASHSKLRKVLTESVTTSFMHHAAPTSDQQGVWKEVSRKLGAMRSSSDTMALEQAYQDTKADLDHAVQELPAPADCAGAVFALNGQIVGVDLFDQPGTLSKLWPKLIRAYAIDALETPNEHAVELSVADVQNWLSKLTTITPHSFPSPGLGEDVRLRHEELVGAGLVVDEDMVHLQAFDSKF